MSAGVKVWGARNIDGVTNGWLPVLIDAAGHIQIDLASTPDVNIASSDITLDINDVTPPYTILTTDDGSDRVEYVGWALPGTDTGTSEWRIAKMSYTAGGNPELKWADGVATFTKEWDLKGDYSYS